MFLNLFQWYQHRQQNQVYFRFRLKPFLYQILFSCDFCSRSMRNLILTLFNAITVHVYINAGEILIPNESINGSVEDLN